MWRSLIGVSVLLMAIVSCAGGGTPGREASDAVGEDARDSLRTVNDVTYDAYEWSDSVMGTMTLEELAGQLIMPAVFSDDSRGIIEQIRRYATDFHVGGVVLLKGTVGGVRVISDTLRSLLPVTPFIAIDAEWGLAMRLADTPEFPRNGKISQSADEDLLFDYGREVAEECRKIGINMILGPVLDVLPAGGKSSGIGSRSFGGDAERVANLGVAYAKGVESEGVISVAKHFPGHGSADADSHRRLPVVTKNREALDSTDLKPFRMYVDNGLSAIMTGHLYVPALEEDKQPVSVSEKVLHDILRDELRFRGLIITDAMNMAGAYGNSALDAIKAGADIVLAPADTEEELRKICKAVLSGDLPTEMLRERVRRVLFFKYIVARGPRDEVFDENSEAERIIKLLR